MECLVYGIKNEGMDFILIKSVWFLFKPKRMDILYTHLRICVYILFYIAILYSFIVDSINKSSTPLIMFVTE